MASPITDQRGGIPLVEILLLTLVVGTLSFVVFRAKKVQVQDSTGQNNQAVTRSETKPLAAGETSEYDLVIKEWGIKINPSPSKIHLIYHYHQEYDAISLSSKELLELSGNSPGCQASHSPLGRIHRVEPGQIAPFSDHPVEYFAPGGGGPPVANKVGSHYFMYRTPHAPCTERKYVPNVLGGLQNSVVLINH